MRGLSLILVAALWLVSISFGPIYAADKTPAQFKDACHCVGCHAEYRWDAKTDDEGPPQRVPNKLTPSAIGKWSGPGGFFAKDTPRKGREKQWIALTGRVTLVKIEVDGDLHIQLVDETAEERDLNVIVEVPFGEPWCDIRKTVFGWSSEKFPFKTVGKKLTLKKHPVITVTGKAFYDAIHDGGDTSKNRRPVPKNAAATTKNVAIWEVHPVMDLAVVKE